MIPGDSAEDTSIVDEQELLGVSACIAVRIVLVEPPDGLPLEACKTKSCQYEFSEMTRWTYPGITHNIS